LTGIRLRRITAVNTDTRFFVNSNAILILDNMRRLIKLIKKLFNFKKNSEAIDLALRMSFEDELDYKYKIEQVSGCIGLPGNKNAAQRIRDLRGE
jgi:hypothetical protein